jgi:hypothetical protein
VRSVGGTTDGVRSISPLHPRGEKSHPDAALLLEVARRYHVQGDDRALPFSYPRLGRFVLTGGRESEVLGLEMEDVSLDRKRSPSAPTRTAGSRRSLRSAWSALAPARGDPADARFRR